jgi:hypothetical protein
MARCVLAATLPTGTAMAIDIKVDNPDWAVRWDNTIRYNLGVRAEKQDSRIMLTSPFSDGKFDRGDVVTNRLDVLSEIDAVYQGKHGARVSAAAWYDQAYHNGTLTNPLTGATRNYDDPTRRFYQGPSGEILDAFAFTNFDVGNVPVGIRLGKHVVYWGEGSLIGGHAISYSQAPSDGRKAVASPGIETKEVFMPINQLSFNAQLTSDLSVGGQYFLDWKPTRVPLGGTYLAGSDGTLYSKEVAKTRGAYGLRLSYNLPENAKLGLYYRKFDDYTPWGATDNASKLGHADNVKLIGVSLGATVAGTSVGWELSRRSNAPLLVAGAAAANVLTQGARGTTYHMVLNATRALPNLPIYDTGTVVAELAYSHFDKVTNGKGANFKGVGAGYAAGCNAGVPAGYSAADIGCATKNYWGLSMVVSPQYLQVAPGLDLTVPLTLTYGIKGNSATTGGGNEGEVSYSVGVTAMYQNKHEIALKYQDRYQRTGYAANGAASGGLSNGSSYALNDRGFLSLTYKTSF